ncbi:transcriptional regulator, PadR family [Agrococcus baldri]|uniref:Transcriptional regulator, PadR family n=1 Tax=Agrococcus baldri TaxID=153730 RepID=A0AA94L004_9MICO|nr:PadR family transcriptional regulator [Agrococcus baldri]SFS15003.1 transcriptional regulator, PadR family [Agrococcus baldri]
MILSRIILGLLAIAPLSGADLKRHFDSTVNHFWSADKAQIYRTLAALVAEGLASVTVVPGTGAPDSQEHRITDAGRAALVAWLTSELDRQPERDAFIARIFLAESLDDEAVGRLLELRRSAALGQLAALEAIEASTGPARTRGEHLRLATLDHGLRHVRTELEWLDIVEEQLP